MERKTISTRHPEKYEHAFLLYMNNMQQKDICKKVQVTPATLQKWKEKGEWEKKRSVKAVSVDALITKILDKANTELDKEGDFSAEAFCKIVSQLKGLKGGATINDEIKAFMEFGDWVAVQINTAEDIDSEFIKKLNKYQDLYITNRRVNG